MAAMKRGTLHAFITGSHGRPQVIMESQVYWREPQGKEWRCEPASILPTRLLQRPGSALLALDSAAGLAMQARSSDPEAYVSMVIESTMGPGVPDAARSRHSDAWGNVRDVRVVAGGDPDKWHGATTRIGASRLSGFFHESIESRGPAYISQAKGVPVAADIRLVAVSFNSYRADDDSLPLSAVKSALASAQDIRRAGNAGDEVLLSTPTEAIAAALMLTLWLACEQPPPREAKLGERRTLSRSAGGIA